jgi:hypothetical protein
MIVIFCVWLVCLAAVFLMVKRAPLMEEDTADDEQPDDTTPSSEFQAKASSEVCSLTNNCVTS